MRGSEEGGSCWFECLRRQQQGSLGIQCMRSVGAGCLLYCMSILETALSIIHCFAYYDLHSLRGVRSDRGRQPLHCSLLRRRGHCQLAASVRLTVHNRKSFCHLQDQT